MTSLDLSDPLQADERARLEAEAERVRASGLLSRSGTIARLFDFLLERSLAGDSPKEAVIAHQVFGRGADEFDVAQDASVRVYIHRLRRKLEEFYAEREGDRIVVPRGEYRLAILRPPADDADLASTEEGGSEPASEPRRAGVWRKSGAWTIALGVLLLANLIGWALLLASWGGESELSAVRETPMWSPLIEDGRPTVIVVGDYYIFGEASDGVSVDRLVRAFEINSREDLDQHLLNHPEQVGRYLDLDLHYLPVSAATALRDLAPLVSSGRAAAERPRIVPSSQLTPALLKSGNIVYVGYLSGLGLLGDLVFDVSRFEVGETFDELVDQATGERYTADWFSVLGGDSQRRDYSYLAWFRGPAGNHIVIVAGTRDPGLAQAAESATDATALDRLGAPTVAAGFEALYEVETLGSTPLASRLVAARPIAAGPNRDWQQAATALPNAGPTARP